MKRYGLFILAAALAAAGLSGCKGHAQKIRTEKALRHPLSFRIHSVPRIWTWRRDGTAGMSYATVLLKRCISWTIH